jgi:hypothetical protein
MIPKNEQETIAIFSQFAEELGYKFVAMGTNCPDVILRQNGNLIRAEFEHKARNFDKHKHSVEAVDLIICWEDDWPTSPLPVLSLENYITIAKPVPGWKKFLMRLQEIRLAYIEYRATIKAARMKLRKKNYCKACGTLMQVSTSPKESNTDLYVQNYVYKTCPSCGYLVIDAISESYY